MKKLSLVILLFSLSTGHAESANDFKIIELVSALIFSQMPESSIAQDTNRNDITTPRRTKVKQVDNLICSQSIEYNRKTGVTSAQHKKAYQCFYPSILFQSSRITLAGAAAEFLASAIDQYLPQDSRDNLLKGLIKDATDKNALLPDLDFANSLAVESDARNTVYRRIWLFKNIENTDVKAFVKCVPKETISLSFGELEWESSEKRPMGDAVKKLTSFCEIYVQRQLKY